KTSFGLNIVQKKGKEEEQIEGDWAGGEKGKSVLSGNGIYERNRARILTGLNNGNPELDIGDTQTLVQLMIVDLCICFHQLLDEGFP
ncbi:hypothetical protein STEG23_020594, partial [Scotinomys teguina]